MFTLQLAIDGSKERVLVLSLGFMAAAEAFLITAESTEWFILNDHDVMSLLIRNFSIFEISPSKTDMKVTKLGQGAPVG